MSTNSIVAIPDGDGWQGRYVHWNGYPTSQGRAIHEIVRRDGLVAAQRQLVIDSPGWSFIASRWETDFIGVRADRHAEYGSAAYVKWHRTHKYGSVRNKTKYNLVDGYGVDYADLDGLMWLTNVDDLDGFEWVYVLADGGLLVIDLNGKQPVPAGLVWWEDDDVDWSRVECGVELERCQHVASYHFPDCTSNLSTDTYLGRVPLTPRDAIGFVDVDGVEWSMTGSGCRGGISKWGFHAPYHSLTREAKMTSRWYASARHGDVSDEVYVWNDHHDGSCTPAPGIELIYPSLHPSVQ